MLGLDSLLCSNIIVALIVVGECSGLPMWSKSSAPPSLVMDVEAGRRGSPPQVLADGRTLSHWVDASWSSCPLSVTTPLPSDPSVSSSPPPPPPPPSRRTDAPSQTNFDPAACGCEASLFCIHRQKAYKAEAKRKKARVGLLEVSWRDLFNAKRGKGLLKPWVIVGLVGISALFVVSATCIFLITISLEY